MAEAKVQRVVLKIGQNEKGDWIMKMCKDAWSTLPFVWPSEASARHDLEIVVSALLKKGYTVVNPTAEEVKA